MMPIKEDDRLVDRFTETREQRAKRIKAKVIDRETAKVIRQALRAQMAKWARQGGKARAKALSPARRREIARKANAAKRAKGGR
jgi:hypothetical protein